jgi:NADPH2:quinone reductase
MPYAIVLESPGDTSRLSWKEAPTPAPASDEVLVRQKAVGVNFIDTYHRTGLYPLPVYPHGLGIEAAGVVEAVGQGAKTFKPGDRVAYAGGTPGAYAELRAMREDLLVPIPAAVDFTVAAAALAKGLTAQYLLKGTYPVQKGDVILMHAAAGGVGLIACQWAKHLGAAVIGTVGDNEKAALAKANGCDHAILYKSEKVSARVRELTGGKGVDVVYDSVGQATFMDSLDCLKPRGMMVSFGQSSGKVEPFDIGLLAQKGSLYITRPTLTHYIAETQAYRRAAAELFDLIGKSVLSIRVDRQLPLKDAAKAHELLEGRATKGSVVLTV